MPSRTSACGSVNLRLTNSFDNNVSSQALKDPAACSSGTIIGNDNLFLDIFSLDAFINLPKGGLFIIDRDSDGEFQGTVTDLLRWWS
jgi:hypothetical protein